jgi:geranylgeranyl pyrophosphate synthase
MLVLLSAGPEGDAATVRAAVAVELIHTASLVHDDVLDRAPLRRGEPTIFATDGRTAATTVGDALFAEAFGLLSRAGDMGSVEVLSTTAIDLVRGELMQRAAAFDTGLSEDEYMARCELKTGSLFASACLLGGRTAGSRDLDAMAGFGSRVGLAFQLLDDVLDVSGPVERTGKARGTDLLDGTVTLPLIEAIATDPAITEIDLHELDEPTAAELCDRIEATGALERVRTRALGLIAEAKSSLSGTGLDRERVELLELVADGVVMRYS